MNRQRNHELFPNQSGRQQCGLAAFGEKNQVEIGEAREVIQQGGSPVRPSTLQRIRRLGREHDDLRSQTSAPRTSR